MYEKNREEIDPLLISELEKDPHNRGYSFATTKETVNLLNDSFSLEMKNPSFGEEGQPEFLQEEQSSRIYSVLYKIPFAPNAITIEDLERLEV